MFTWTCSKTRIDIAVECRHDMRPSVQLPSVSGDDSKLGLTMFAVGPPALDPPPASKRDASFLFFDLRWPWPLIFSSENWHCTYACRGKRLYQFWFICVFCFAVTSPYGTDGQTDRRTGKKRNHDPVMARTVAKKFTQTAPDFPNFEIWQISRDADDDAGMWSRSRSRDRLETYQRLVSVSSRSRPKRSRRLVSGLGPFRLVETFRAGAPAVHNFSSPIEISMT